MKKLQRRDFLKFAGGSVAAYTLPLELSASEQIDDYKALVIINLHGANDSLNMFIPSDEDSNIFTGYKQYLKNRQKIGIKNNDLIGKLGTHPNLSLKKKEGNPYYQNSGNTAKAYLGGFYKHQGAFKGKVATNAMMPEVAHLLNQGKGAVIQNVGNIIKKATKEELIADKSLIPYSYSSHRHGQKYTATSMASNITTQSGWLGRLADRWQGINGQTLYKMNIDLNPYGNSLSMFSFDSEALKYSKDGANRFNNMHIQTEKEFFEDISSIERRELFKRLFNNKRYKALNESESLSKDWEDESDNKTFSSLKNPYGDDLFSMLYRTDLGLSSNTYNDVFIPYFEAIAKLISIGKKKGLKREVFLIESKNFDTHTNQAVLHANSLRALSIGIGDFQLAMGHLGLEDSVTTFTTSEFGRTAVDNGSGTDHGWGGSQFVIGGAVKAGNYGKMPDLRPGGPDDISLKGRIIPSTSNSQYFATIAKWFGADESTLESVFPELKNFDKHDLGFMKKS